MSDADTLAALEQTFVATGGNRCHQKPEAPLPDGLRYQAA